MGLANKFFLKQLLGLIIFQKYHSIKAEAVEKGGGDSM